MAETIRYGQPKPIPTSQKRNNNGIEVRESKMRNKKCPTCKGEGQVMVTNSLGEVILDSDGLAFYNDCTACMGTGYVPVDYEAVVDDREGKEE